MRCIIRPLLFLQSCFYVILGKINSIIDQLQNHVVQELDCWFGPSFMVWNSFLSGMGVSWAGLQWQTFLQVLNIYSEERECLMHYWLWRPMSSPCLPASLIPHNIAIWESWESYNPISGGIILLFGLLGYITSCLSSVSFAYCYSIIILVFVIIQCIFGIITVLFR